MLPVFFSSHATILDCGASRTVLGEFSRKGGRLRLEHYAVEYFPASTGGEDHWLAHTQAALAALRRRTKSAGPVTVVLPAHLTLTKVIKAPRAEPAQRQKVIRFEAGQNIPYALADVVWGSVVAGEFGNNLEVMLVAAKREAIEPVCAAAQAAGFDLQVILPSPLATLAGFRLAGPALTQPALVLNLGARSTTLLGVEASGFVVRTLSLGCQPGLRQTANHPDDGRGRDAEAVALATRLAQEINRFTLHFGRQWGKESPKRIFLTGGGAGHDGLRNALALKLKGPVDRLDAGRVIELGEGLSGANAIEQPLTDLIGAAAIQFFPDQPVINLLPAGRLELGKRRRLQPWLIAAALLITASPVPFLIHFRAVTREARSNSAAIERELAPQRERSKRIHRNLTQLGELNRQFTQLRSVYDRRDGWLNLLADLQDRLVRIEDVWLERLHVIPDQAGGPLKLEISGRMLDTANPQSKASSATFSRASTLRESLVDSVYIAAVEGERFDSSQPGMLRFDFVLVADTEHPL